MSETAIRPVATSSIDRGAVMAIALVLLVFAIGYRIPIPGLDVATLIPQLQGPANASAMARVSILALGVMPLFTVLTVLELLRLVIPPLARWETAGGAGWVRIIATVLALGIAALQGMGIAAALEETGLVRSDALGSFTASAVACFVGSTALLAWLAWSIRLPGIGSGFWLLLAVPFLAALPAEVAIWVTYLQSGAATMLQVLMVVAYVLVATAAVAFLQQALRGHVADGEGAMTVSASLLIWPPLLAGMVAGFVLALALMLPGGHTTLAPLLQMVGLVVTVLLIPLFVWIYAHRLVLKDVSSQETRRLTPVLTMVVVAQVAILLLGELLQTRLPLPFSLSGTMLIVTVLVLMSPFLTLRASASARMA